MELEAAVADATGVGNERKARHVQRHASLQRRRRGRPQPFDGATLGFAPEAGDRTAGAGRQRQSRATAAQSHVRHDILPASRNSASRSADIRSNVGGQESMRMRRGRLTISAYRMSIPETTAAMAAAYEGNRGGRRSLPDRRRSSLIYSNRSLHGQVAHDLGG